MHTFNLSLVLSTVIFVLGVVHSLGAVFDIAGTIVHLQNVAVLIFVYRIEITSYTQRWLL